MAQVESTCLGSQGQSSVPNMTKRKKMYYYYYYYYIFWLYWCLKSMLPAFYESSSVT
jgi:hypothetical protein